MDAQIHRNRPIAKQILEDYRLAAAGVVNMFPHTAHVESLAVFDRE